MAAPKCFCCGTELNAKPQKASGRPYLSCPEGCVQIMVRTSKAATLYAQKYGALSGAPAPKADPKREEPDGGKAKAQGDDVLDWD